MYTIDEKKKLKEIKALFEQIDEIYNSFEEHTKEAIFHEHNEEGSLPHCIRWGLQAAEELVDSEDVPEIGAKYIVLKEMNTGEGLIPPRSEATLTGVDFDLIHEEDALAFQFEFHQFFAFKEEDAADGTFMDMSLDDVKKYLHIKELSND